MLVWGFRARQGHWGAVVGGKSQAGPWGAGVGGLGQAGPFGCKENACVWRRDASVIGIYAQLSSLYIPQLLPTKLLSL